MIDYQKLYSETALNTKKSAIRELLKLADRPEVISLAGGWPSPELFPVQVFKELSSRVLESNGKKTLHYSKAEGEDSLKSELIKLMAKDNVNVGPENILVLTGSQQGLDMLPKAFVDRGDIVFTESPTYVGAIQAFQNYGTRMIPVDTDESGMDPAALEKAIAECRSRGLDSKMKMIYLIPDFQNPAGITMSLERREKVLDIAAKNGLLVIDDAPYRYLRFNGEKPPSLYTLDTHGSVVSLYTFSKIMVPGFRMAWLVGSAKLVDKLVTLKQSVDLCSSAFLQQVTAEYLKQGYMDTYLPVFIDDYRKKRDVMLAALSDHMPELEGLKWTRPEGGLFIWVTLPEKMSSEELFHSAIEENVAFVVGSAFHPQGGLKNTLRLNFSYVDTDTIREGVKRLGLAVKNYAVEKKLI